MSEFNTSMDLRDFCRVRVALPAVVKHAGGISDATVTDLSLHGMCLKLASRLRLDEVVHVTLRSAPSDGEGDWIMCNGEVVRRDDGEIGIRITGMDRTSFEKLRRLVIRSADDPDRVERELRRFVSRTNG